MPPDPPSFICIYIPLHSINISACTSIIYITALHVFYRCLGYHIYIHVPAPLLYFVITPPPPPPHHPAIYIQYIHQIYVYILHAVIHCSTQASPPIFFILDRTLQSFLILVSPYVLILNWFNFMNLVSPYNCHH